MNVRSALLYRKNFATLVEESVREPPLVSVASVSNYALGNIHSSCYCPKLLDSPGTPFEGTCATDMFCVWVLGIVQVSAMCSAVL